MHVYLRNLFGECMVVMQRSTAAPPSDNKNKRGSAIRQYACGKCDYAVTTLFNKFCLCWPAHVLFSARIWYHLICKIACLVLKSYFYFSSEVSNVMCLRGNTYTGCTFATLVAGNLSFEKNYWVFAKNPAEFWNFLSFGAAEFFQNVEKKAWVSMLKK